MLNPVTLHMLRRHDLIEKESLAAITEQIGPGTSRARRRWFWICFTLGVAGLIGALARATALGRSLDLVGRVLWSVNAICLAFGVFVLWRSGRQDRLRRVRSAMLYHLRCPHCGYLLTGLPIDSNDGATVCPECGCAWILGDRSIKEGTDHA